MFVKFIAFLEAFICSIKKTAKDMGREWDQELRRLDVEAAESKGLVKYCEVCDGPIIPDDPVGFNDRGGFVHADVQYYKNEKEGSICATSGRCGVWTGTCVDADC